jgi:hypothetical protein
MLAHGKLCVSDNHLNEVRFPEILSNAMHGIDILAELVSVKRLKAEDASHRNWHCRACWRTHGA